MDTDRGLTDQRVDDALHHLFQEAGHGSPSPGFEQRILNRLAVAPRSIAPYDRPLIPWAGWALGGTFVGALILVAILFPSNGNGIVAEFMRRAPHFDLHMDWRSPWLFVFAACGALFHLLDQTLTRRTRFRASQR